MVAVAVGVGVGAGVAVTVGQRAAGGGLVAAAEEVQIPLACTNSVTGCPRVVALSMRFHDKMCGHM